MSIYQNKNNNLQLIDILGNSSNNLSFSPSNKVLIYSLGSYIIHYNLKINSKIFIQYHLNEVSLVKTVNNNYMISIDNNSSPLLVLWDINYFNCLSFVTIKPKKISLIDSIYLEQKNKENFLILITTTNSNLLYELTIENEICIVEFIENISNIENSIYGFKVFYNSNDLIIMLKNSIQIYSTNQLNKKYELKYNINFPFKLLKNSLRISDLNLISFLTEKGNCLIYDKNGNNQPSIFPFAQESFTTCEFCENSLYCCTNNGRIYCYDIIDYKIQFYIDNISLIEYKEKFLLNKNDKTNFNNKDFIISHSIQQIFVDEKFDVILIKSSDNSIFFSSISSLKQDFKQLNFISINNKISLFTFSHSNKIINIELKPKDENIIENIFYTNSTDQTVIKYIIDNDKLSNEYYDIEKINKKLSNFQNYFNSNNKIYISTIKFHPIYKNILFVGDNKGAIYIFDTNINLFKYKRYITGTFEITHLSFNSLGNLICIGFVNGMNIICDINKEYEFILKLSDPFLTPNEIEKRKENNQITSFNYFFQNINDIILYNKTNKEIEISKLYFDHLILCKNIISLIQYEDIILDIDIHISENYLICLTDKKQIIINKIDNCEITAILNLNNQIDKVYNFCVDNSGLYIALICDLKDSKSHKSNLIIFEIGTGKIQTYINNAFPMSKCKFTYGGDFLAIAGIKGDFTIWKLNKEMSLSINNVNLEMKKNKNFWESYEIKYSNDNKNNNLFEQQFNMSNNNFYYLPYQNNIKSENTEFKENNVIKSNIFEHNLINENFQNSEMYFQQNFATKLYNKNMLNNDVNFNNIPKTDNLIQGDEFTQKNLRDILKESTKIEINNSSQSNLLNVSNKNMNYEKEPIKTLQYINVTKRNDYQNRINNISNANNEFNKCYKGMDESREFYINNKEDFKIKDKNKIKYPEPEDIDDGLIEENPNVDINNNNDITNENEQLNFNINMSSMKNDSSIANDIDYLEQGVNEFEIRNKFFK